MYITCRKVLFCDHAAMTGIISVGEGWADYFGQAVGLRILNWGLRSWALGPMG